MKIASSLIALVFVVAGQAARAETLAPHSAPAATAGYQTASTACADYPAGGRPTDGARSPGTDTEIGVQLRSGDVLEGSETTFLNPPPKICYPPRDHAKKTVSPPRHYREPRYVPPHTTSSYVIYPTAYPYIPFPYAAGPYSLSYYPVVPYGRHPHAVRPHYRRY